METDRKNRRTEILDEAQDLILQQGFAGTSVEAILERVGLTKGAFFHHFRSKSELALALIQRFAQRDSELLEGAIARAEKLTRDPVQQVLVLAGLLTEIADEMTEPAPGCLFASFCYETQLFDEDVHDVIREGFLHWRSRLGEKFRAAMEHRQPRLPADPDDLADMVTVVSEGAFILSRSLKEPKVAARQLRLYRDYLELLFSAA